MQSLTLEASCLAVIGEQQEGTSGRPCAVDRRACHGRGDCKRDGRRVARQSICLGHKLMRKHSNLSEADSSEG